MRALQLTERGRPLLACGLLAIAMMVAGPALAKSSIGIGSADTMTAPSGGLFGDVFLQIAVWQREFFSALREALVALKRDGSGSLVFLVGLSFAYGIFHAAGPGHGKAVISSYVLASRAELKRGVLLAFASSLVQAMTAIVAVGVGWFVLRGTSVSMTEATDWLEIASYALVILFGLYLLAKALTRLMRMVRPLERLRGLTARISNGSQDGGGAMGALAFAAPGEARRPTMASAEALPAGAVCASTAEDCGCGRAHIASPEQLRGPMNLRTALAAIFAVGLRPCAGAIVVLTFALLNGLYAGGVLSVFAMALGTAITVSALASLTVLGRGALEAAGRRTKQLAAVTIALELLGAGLLTLVGVGLLGGALVAL